MKLKFDLVKNFFLFVKDVKSELKSEVLDKNHLNKTLGTQELAYIAAFKDVNHLQVVEELAKKYDDMNIYLIENSFLKAIYIDSKYNYNMLFLAAKEGNNPLKAVKYNYGNDSKITTEFRNTIAEKNIISLMDFGFDTTVNILTAFDISIANRYGFSMNQMDYLKMINTQKMFVYYYTLYRSDKKQIEDYDFTHYDHIRSFSLNYYAIIKVISDMYKSEGNFKGLTIHDAGTNTSQLALMLSTLNEDELMGLKVNEIIASDLVILSQDKTQKYINQFPTHKPIKFVEQDFTDESKDLPESDVTILNDVLEHFPTDEMSFYIMKRFWESTRKLLIVHVPQEEKPSPEWDHYITFNKQKLSKWASRLSSALSLGDNYSFKANLKYSDCGFLILKKVN